MMSGIIVQASALYSFLNWDYTDLKYKFKKIHQTVPSNEITVVIAYK